MSEPKVITSLTNPLVKDIRALSMKKARDERGAFLGEGLKLVTDALDEAWPVEAMVHARDVGGQAPVARAAARVRTGGGQVLEVTPAVLAKITRRDNPQMVVGVFGQRLASFDAVKAEPGAVWVALEEIRDPGNLGTIIRTVDAVGARGVILVGDTCDPFSVEAVRATMGSLFHVPLVRAAREPFIAWAKSFPGRLVGTHLKGTTDYRSIAASAPTVLVMGGEQRGLTDAMAAACHDLVKIPMRGKADSLNLAVSTGIMLYRLCDADLRL